MSKYVRHNFKQNGTPSHAAIRTQKLISEYLPGFGRKVFDLVTPRFNPLDKRKPATDLIRLGKYMEWD